MNSRYANYFSFAVAHYHLKETWTETNCCKQSCFWGNVVLHIHWGIWSKICYKLYMKTLKN